VENFAAADGEQQGFVVRPFELLLQDGVLSPTTNFINISKTAF